MKCPHLHEVGYIREASGAPQRVGHMPSSFISRKIGTVAQIGDNGIAVVLGHNVIPRLKTRPAQNHAGPVPACPGVVSGGDLPERSVKKNIPKTGMEEGVLPPSIQVDKLIDSVVDFIFNKTTNNVLLAVDYRFDQEPVKSCE